jgi:hypothetical protein
MGLQFLLDTPNPHTGDDILRLAVKGNKIFRRGSKGCFCAGPGDLVEKSQVWPSAER